MASAPTREIGHLDTYYAGLWLGDWLEQIPDLIWPNSVQTYARMRHDPQLTGVLAAYTLPIRRATWMIDPAGCRDEVVQLVADDLGLPILGADVEPGPARRRGVSWADHLRLALLSLTYGFSVFERRYEIRNGLARLINLGERLPHTIGAINLHRDGTIRSIQQDIAPASNPIPADRLAWYVHEREGANWAGRSIMRASYGPWLLKHEMWRVNATAIRRFGMGVPSVTAPTGATPAQVAEAQRLASSMRVGDQAGVGLPAGFQLAITGMTGSAPDAMAMIHYLDQQMSRSALAGLMDLGDTSNGSRALGQSFLDLFLLSLQSVADEIADAATSGQPGIDGIVTQLVDYNWGDDEPAPKIVVQDVGARPEVTAEALDLLIRSGAIDPDPELEAYVRKTWKLPERDPDAPTSRPTTPPPAPDPAPEPPAARARRRPRARQPRAATAEEGTRRQLTLDEDTSGMDPAAIQQAWQEALDELLVDWQDIAETWRGQLGEQIEQALDDEDLEALCALSLDWAAAAALLTAAMVALAGTSADQMAAEAASQGVTVEPPPVDEEGLGAVATVIATLLAVWLAGAAAREALRLTTPGAAAATVAAAVVAFLAGLSDRFLRDQLGAALSQAQASGRFAVLHEAPDARYLSSEVLDPNTCGPCRDIDGQEFDDLAAAEAAYGTGSYIDCQGGVRCRGTVYALWT
ncbi:DUF935 domain-containing protein [Actinomadura sp. ATCC 31491]|uniref:DUF935 domain-containing protein n=1 Tax=Actinomadura luzonensis TaxID=2805427 RepID=A0ABT0G5B9_9ACTN|nr:DUF935 family protein [Actinomadura luzonensis]MCK2219704.1 DUF935 domain-containing protein [Actinomadura luzonensis]